MEKTISKKKEWICLAVGFLGSILGVYATSFCNQQALALPILPRMPVLIAEYWLIALVPIIVMLINGDRLSDYGFTKENLPFQILIGVLLGAAMSLVLTFVPHLLGFGSFVDNGHRYQYLWQFVYDFSYYIFSVGCVEELVFRGFVYQKIKAVSQKDVIALIGSSVLFGLFHFPSGNIIQMVMTAFIGAFFCFCRMKIKHCSTLSLIIAHGVYDALITVWASLLLRA